MRSLSKSCACSSYELTYFEDLLTPWQLPPLVVSKLHPYLSLKNLKFSFFHYPTPTPAKPLSYLVMAFSENLKQMSNVEQMHPLLWYQTIWRPVWAFRFILCPSNRENRQVINGKERCYRCTLHYLNKWWLYRFFSVFNWLFILQTNERHRIILLNYNHQSSSLQIQMIFKAQKRYSRESVQHPPILCSISSSWPVL